MQWSQRRVAGQTRGVVEAGVDGRREVGQGLLWFTAGPAGGLAVEEVGGVAFIERQQTGWAAVQVFAGGEQVVEYSVACRTFGVVADTGAVEVVPIDVHSDKHVGTVFF